MEVRETAAMGKTNKCNIEDDEALAEEVRKYPCLYDKSDKGYKEKDRNINAWRAVDSALNYVEGNSFQNIYRSC